VFAIGNNSIRACSDSSPRNALLVTPSVNDTMTPSPGTDNSFLADLPSEWDKKICEELRLWGPSLGTCVRRVQWYPFVLGGPRCEYAAEPAAKYGWLHAALAEIRCAGSYSSMASSNSRPAGSSVGTSFDVGSRRHLGNEVLKSGKEVTPGQVFSSGVPRSLCGIGQCMASTAGHKDVNVLEDFEDLVDF
jgi:hypothetical protein